MDGKRKAGWRDACVKIAPVEITCVEMCLCAGMSVRRCAVHLG